jgi:endonuclease/exonuclease/phosphatase family metal-dependent hydrolase
MRKRYIVLGVLAVALLAYGAAFAMLNSNSVASTEDLEIHSEAQAPAAPDALNLMIWNLGYGGLGAESDFVADGGTSYFPPSREAVRTNVAGIESTIRSYTAQTDVFIFQEIARGGPVNYWTNLKRRVDDALGARPNIFFADFKTRLMPWPLAMTHGQAIYSNFAIANPEVIALPAEDASIFGVKRRYASVVARLPMEDGGGWTIASVHLAAFDPDAAVRTRQLRELLAWAQREYESGQYVVLGGDWNFQIAETNFPNTTDERFLFWLFPFPQDALPEGWRIAADGTIPSVRTNYQRYIPGENYTTTIDGFIVSPNVEVRSVSGTDLGFQHSDHQAVRIRVRAIRGASE